MEKAFGIKILSFVFAALLLFSCEKPRGEYSELAMVVPKTHNTKTHLEPDPINRLFDVVWDANDRVKVYDANGGEGIYTNKNVYEDDHHEVAHFGGEGIDLSATINAFYPVSIAKSANEFELPQEQIYKSRNDGYIVDYPMWAQETNNDHVWFRNLTGILILRIRGQQGTQIRKVYVKEPSDPAGPSLRGTFSVTASGSTHTNEPVVTQLSQGRDIVLNCSSNPTSLTANESSLFYLSVPQSSHGRLLIGVEYKLPTMTEWATTYQMIYASSYGEPRFIFERSKWTSIDVDFSGLDGSLIYSLLNINLNPNQYADTVINTDMPVTSAFHEYTFVIDITPDDITSADEHGYYRRAIYSEMDNVTVDWKGIIIRLGKENNRGNTKLEINIGTSVSLFSTRAVVSGVRHQFVITIQDYNNNYGRVRIYFMRNGTVAHTTATFRKTEWISGANPIPEVGGDQHISGRYFDGEIHSFRIYDRVWTTQEINNFIHQ